MIPAHHQPGARVEVCSGLTLWMPGTVESQRLSITGGPYALDVMLDEGYCLTNLSPQTVRPAPIPTGEATEVEVEHSAPGEL